MAPQRAIDYIAALDLPGDEAFCIIACDVKQQSRQQVANSLFASVEYVKKRRRNGYSSRRDEYDMRGRSRRGTHYVRGHYSRDGAIDNMKRQLQEMLDNADDESIRRAIQRCMDTIEG